MAKGFGAVVAASADINERKNSGGEFSGKRWFRIYDGDVAIVRFLEEGAEVVSFWAHQTPPPPGRSFGSYVACRDQDPETGERIGEDCPGCDRGYKRRFRGVINLIWRDAPVFERDEETGKVNRNKVVGNEDAVVLWETGIEVFEDLQILDEDYKGLTTRDFKVRRKGEKLNTSYTITPAEPDGGAKSMSDSDKELADNKYDLEEFTSPAPLDTWGKRTTVNQTAAAINTDVSPFRRRLEE